MLIFGLKYTHLLLDGLQTCAFTNQRFSKTSYVPGPVLSLATDTKKGFAPKEYHKGFQGGQG